ncbi:hypothetical protein [Microvirga antarctica]|uniref:hypothetical protein n=1 Tax=Microvirga antarctica TaxID=2819233 RepID=UPI001B313A37|nr:hypothetical protein [Microvirga antarctica]
MKRSAALVQFGHIGLIVAAFALVAGIVGAPLVGRLFSPDRVAVMTPDEPVLRAPTGHVVAIADDHG